METIKVRFTEEQKLALQPFADKLIAYHDSTGMRGMLLAQVWVTFNGFPSHMEVGLLDSQHGDQMIAIVKDQDNNIKEGRG